MISWEAWDGNVRNRYASVDAVYCFLGGISRIRVKLKKIIQT